MEGFKEEVIIVTGSGMSGLDAGDIRNIETAAKWARFLAIVQFVMLGLGAVWMLLGILATGVAGTSLPGMTPAMGGWMLGMFIFVLAVILVAFIPAIYMFRSARKALAAVRDDSSVALSESLVNLRRLCKFQGILTIVMIVVYLIMMISMFFMGIGSVLG